MCRVLFCFVFFLKQSAQGNTKLTYGNYYKTEIWNTNSLNANCYHESQLNQNIVSHLFREKLLILGEMCWN